MRACADCKSALTKKEAEERPDGTVVHKNGCPELRTRDPFEIGDFVSFREAVIAERGEVLGAMREVGHRLELGQEEFGFAITRARRALDRIDQATETYKEKLRDGR